jgi:manganese efflux pump family protein
VGPLVASERPYSHGLRRRIKLPSTCWRYYAAKIVVTWVVLAAGAVACASQPAATPGSATSCFQFAVGAIKRHVTVTAVPAACQGLSRLEVNVAVRGALQAEAAGVRGKVRQRQLIARDIRYVAGLIRAVPAPSQQAVEPPQSQSSSPSRAALSLAALLSWLVTVGLGVSMMARWITRTRRRGTRPRHGRGPVLNFTHFGLALTGLAIWISYLATGLTGLAWAACGLLLAVASLGMTLVFLGPASSPVTSTTADGSVASAAAATAAETRPGDDPPPRPVHPPVPVVAAHITAACITILLATLAAIGVG